MRKSLPAIVWLLLLYCPSLSAAEFTDHVVSVLDGDTTKSWTTTMQNASDSTVSIAPEKGQAYCARAKQGASALVFGKAATLQGKLVLVVSELCAIRCCD